MIGQRLCRGRFDALFTGLHTTLPLRGQQRHDNGHDPWESQGSHRTIHCRQIMPEEQENRPGPLPVHATSMAKIMAPPIYVGEGKNRVKNRVGDIFKDALDIALKAGAYGLKGDPIGLSSVLTNLPTEYRGVLLAKIEMERGTTRIGSS